MRYEMSWVRLLLFGVLTQLPLFAASANIGEAELVFGEMNHLGMAPCGVPCEVIYEHQQVDTCQIQNETLFEERWVTTYEPVWETEIRKCHYTVARPEIQTVEKEVRCVEIKPVWETQVCDRSYDVVRQIVETKEVEERYTVSRPVMETECREQKVQVQRCVTRTVEKEVDQITHQPVTRVKTTYVDQGQYVSQQVEKPRRFQFSFLKWAPGGWGVDPANGKKRYEIPGFVWVKQPKMRAVSERVWEPRQVAVEVPETTYEQVVTKVKVPTEVSEWVVEEEIRRVPVCVCKMVTEECVRIVPVTTCREVIERVENKVTVPVCRYLREEKVQVVPCTYTRMMYEQRVRDVPVRVCKMVAVRKKILVPRSVKKMVPGKKTVSLARLIVLRQQPQNRYRIDPFLAASESCRAFAGHLPTTTIAKTGRAGTYSSLLQPAGRSVDQWAYVRKRTNKLVGRIGKRSC